MRTVLHRPGVLTVEHFLSPRECVLYIRLAEQIGFEPATVKTAAGPALTPEHGHNLRCVFDDAEVASQLWTRLSPRLSALALDGVPTAVNRRIRFYKYPSGQPFLAHRDETEEVHGLTNELSFLIYLNDNFVDGETVFSDRQRQLPELVITPKAGNALLFLHPLWHEGAKLSEGTKYVMRSDVLCRPR